ncbi:MAG: PEP-CTERM sorting domain-containing protein [Planctomycetes bacterium]|jgi:hypothetical protein|nr:PEP-CTERM sorting domain-containing protein [Phycisphaerae bacterium]NBB94949.1 PEP-CTERM sorting domain-containing protein [Planctomycetota bacterium]
MLKRVFVFAGMLCALAASANAAPYTMDGMTVDIESWTGSGASETILVLDYNDVESNSGSGGTGNGVYYFGYNWDGSARTVWDMMADIQATEPTLDFHATNWGTESEPNYFVDGWAYGTDDYTAVWDSTYSEWVKQWLSGDGQTWVDGNGVSADTLVDGGWTGLVFQYDGSNDAPQVPEPASLVLLGAGGLALLRRRSGK